MGNETSQFNLEIDEKAVEVTDFWTHHSAVMNSDNVTPLSVFIGEPLVGGSLWINQTPLEKATKNLMLHRHPCILKYISSWNKGSKLYLAVDYVKPLAHVIANQTTLQICIGLHSILKAISFLHEKALASHNNICSACVYVTQDGSWKLGGLEYLCRFQDLNLDYLNKTRSHRYEKAIDPSENTNYKNGAIDKYAFAVLVEEVLYKKTNQEVPYLEEFRTFCRTLQSKESPCLSAVLKHEFFTHNFIVIYSFLTELPLKLENERQEFFTSLCPKLRTFPEEIVARQLGELLLSRLVLLDRTAQTIVLPFILVPKSTENEGHIFSETTFKQIIVPKLLHIFRVRDAQIRLLLLSHFRNFVHYFTKEQLQNHILPELLIGIKDTNDHLVSITLVALSDLVPILGAATVIGGKRAKLFNDGRPTVNSIKKHKKPARRTDMEHSDLESTSINSTDLFLNQMLALPERPSPDGGEEEISTTEQDQSAEDDLEIWSDWEVNESIREPLIINQEIIPVNISSEVVHSSNPDLSLINSVNVVNTNKTLPDISELDIKNQKNLHVEKERSDEFDFFQGMEPVIELTNVVLIEDDTKKDDVSKISLNVSLNGHHDVEEGWGDDLDWAEN